MSLESIFLHEDVGGDELHVFRLDDALVFHSTHDDYEVVSVHLGPDRAEQLRDALTAWLEGVER